MKNSYFSLSDGAIVFRMCEIVGMHVSMLRFAKQIFDPSIKISMHDIALL